MYLTYDVIHKKLKQKPKIFFSLQTRRLAKPFEGWNSSLVQLAGRAMPLLNHMKTAWF